MISAIHKYRRGIYATIIFHLCLIIGLMGLKISAVRQEVFTEIKIDMDEKEEQERLHEEERALQRELAREIRSQIFAEQERLRNAAVNEEIPKDIKDKVLAENDDLQRRIASTYKMMRQQDGDVPLPENAKKNQTTKPYTGPSVLSYMVKGRKATYLPVPVYKCEAGGRVVVIIIVNEHGNVTDSQVDRQKSAVDDCLRQSAVEAALRSKFNVAEGKRQQGSITYQFISQYEQ